jgi:hypothetical protein
VAGADDRSPHWPATGFRSCEELGCRREAGRTARYELRLTGGDGEAQSCPVPEPLWQATDAGTRLKGRVRVVTGSVVCDSLEAE